MEYSVPVAHHPDLLACVVEIAIAGKECLWNYCCFTLYVLEYVC
jgi:hypothetical protein